MKTEYFLFNNSSQRKVVKEICEIFPYISVSVLSQALIIETIDLSNLTRFVISTENCNSILVANLEAHKESHSLYRVIPTIYIISHE